MSEEKNMTITNCIAYDCRPHADFRNFVMTLINDEEANYTEAAKRLFVADLDEYLAELPEPINQGQ